MYCGTRTIAIASGSEASAFPLRCRAWTCKECAPRRRRQLIRDAMDGAPNRFITLTVNPHCFSGPEERGQRLARAWRDYVREWRRKRPNGQLHYLVVVELTKRGEPHLHIIMRGDRVPQKELSAFMKQAMSAPVVDVRMIRDPGEVEKYVTKYISKRPIKLGTLKRYWRSLHYFTEEALKRRNNKKPKRAVWLLDISLSDLRNVLALQNVVQWQRHPDMTAWTMYEWEQAPPIASALVRRMVTKRAGRKSTALTTAKTVH